MKAPKSIDQNRLEELQLTVPLKPIKKRAPIARIIDSFVTTDSVVATLTVITDNTTRRIEVDWGDENREIVNKKPGAFLETQPVNADDTLPEGTYRLYHQYEVPENARPFEHSVFLRVDDSVGGVDFRIHRITIRPRFKVTHFPMTVRLKHGCDPSYESTSEFEIQQTVGGELINEWKWQPSNNFFGISQNNLLEGSGVSREFELSAIGEPGSGYENISFEFKEKDWIWDDFVRIYLYMTLDERGYQEYFSERIEETASGDGCSIIYSFTKEMKLIAPLPTSSPVVFV